MSRDTRIVVGLLALSALVRLVNLGKEPLWFDEAHAWMTSSLPLIEQWNWAEPVDIGNPPLFFTLLTAWRHLYGDSEVALRALSALSSIATVPVVFLIARDVGGPALATFAGLLMALAPFNVRYAQEARPYAFMSLAISIAMLAVVRLIHTHRPAQSGSRGSLRWYAVLFGAANAAALLTHNTAIFPVAGLYVVVALAWTMRDGTSAPRLAMAAAVSLTVTIVLWSVWWPGVVTEFTFVKRDFWIPPPSVSHIVGSFYPVYAGHVVREEFGPTSWEVGAVAIATIFAGVIAASAFWRWRRDPINLSLMTVLTVLVPTLMIATSFWVPVLLPRTALWLTIPSTIVVASGILQARPVALRKALVVVILGVNLYGLSNYHVHFQKEAWRNAAALVARDYRDGDVIVFCAGYLDIPFSYYFRDSGLRPRKFHVDSTLDPTELNDILTTASGSASRVWLIYGHQSLADPAGAIPRALAARQVRQSQANFYAVRVDLYAAAGSK